MRLADLPQEFVVPDYGGGSIANIPAVIAELLGAPFEGLPPLRPELWRPLAGGVRRVVLITIDAMGWNLFQRQRQDLGSVLARSAVTGQLTSVFPSTTVNALTCLWTGLAPAQHGLVGLNIFFPHYAVLGQMIKLSPQFISYPDALVEAGLDPETFLFGPGLGEQLGAAGIATHAFKAREIVDSALSRMHGRGVDHHYGLHTSTEMFVQIGRLLEAQPGRPMFISGYWHSIDSLTHKYGWADTAVAAELRSLMQQMEAELLVSLSPEARRGTIVLVTADHGQVDTPPDERIFLDHHPDLAGRLLMRPAGEPRTPYLYARQGQVGPLLDYLGRELAESAVAATAADFLAAGLLGPEPHAAPIADRLADVVATMRGGHVLLAPDEVEYADRMVNRHGGLTAAEMEVPWLGFRLDG